MQELHRLIAASARCRETVLITGETGTGKELVAQTIHDRSDRASKLFVAVNCCSLTGDLLESELFGHVRGSFTGAVNDKKGLFRAADGGTIFLDEVGDMSAVLQARLLRVLQEQTIRPVGGEKEYAVDARVIAATNQALSRRIKEGVFRRDLFYRLRVIPIQVPPLRERVEDIPLLVRYFLDVLVTETGLGRKVIENRVMELFTRHPWPGNVRELENVIRGAMALATDGRIQYSDVLDTLDQLREIEQDDVPEKLGPVFIQSTPVRALPSEVPDLYAHGDGTPLRNLPSAKEVYRRYLAYVLQRSRTNEEAAHILGVTPRTLYSHRRAFGLDRRFASNKDVESVPLEEHDE